MISFPNINSILSKLDLLRLYKLLLVFESNQYSLFLYVKEFIVKESLYN